MPGKSVTNRLAALRKKQANIDAQIKKVESEHAQELRKEKHERARIIGMALLRKVEDGAWTEEQLLELVEPFITSGKEKRFLGIAASAAQAAGKSGKPASERAGRKSSTTVTTVSSAEKKPAAKSKAKPLPESDDSEALASEFNL